MAQQTQKGKRQSKKLTYAELERKVASTENELNSYKGKLPKLGEVLTFEDGKPMVYRDEKLGITATMYDHAAVVMTGLGMTISMSTTIDYATLYNCISISRKKLRAEKEEDITDEMMTKGEEQMFMLGMVLMRNKWMSNMLVFEDRETKMLDGALAYILYNEFLKYHTALLDAADKAREDNPELERQALEDMASQATMGNMLQGLGDSMLKGKLPKENIVETE